MRVLHILSVEEQLADDGQGIGRGEPLARAGKLAANLRVRLSAEADRRQTQHRTGLIDAFRNPQTRTVSALFVITAIAGFVRRTR